MNDFKRNELMAFIAAQVKLVNGDGKVYVKTSANLQVNPVTTPVPIDLNSDIYTVISGGIYVGDYYAPRFYFVAGDKVITRKEVWNGSSMVVTDSNVVTVNQTGWFPLKDFSPVGFKADEYSQANPLSCTYFIEPVAYLGTRYYGGTAQALMRISSKPFCYQLVCAGSELAPVGIKESYTSYQSWGETNANTGVTALVIPAWMENISGLFDGASTIGGFTTVPLPKIITLGKIKNMHRAFYNAFSYGMFTFTTPLGTTVFGEMDVSEVTDFSYCFGQGMQVNPDIENWNVASATNMTGMFQIVVDFTTDLWTRDLSKWCVANIISQPANFSLNHPMSVAQKPVWGTCPRGENLIAGKTLIGKFTLESGIPRAGTKGYNRNYYLIDSNLYVASGQLTPNNATVNGVNYTLTAVLITTGTAPSGAPGYQVNMHLDKKLGDILYMKFNNVVYKFNYHYVSVDDYNYILNPIWTFSDGPYPDISNGGVFDLYY